MKAQPIVHMSAEHFYDMYENVPEKYELWEGVPILKYGLPEHMMAGGTAKHNAISLNLAVAAKTKLKGSGCRPYGSDMGLRLNWDTIAYPDLAIYCDPRDLGTDAATTKDFAHPKVIFEVLSPSTAKHDQTEKLFAYQRIESVRAIVIIDPTDERLTVHLRTSAEAWTMQKRVAGSDLILTDPTLTLTAAEIFDLT